VGLSYDEFNALFANVEREAVHLEMRDSYGTAIELPYMARWAAGEPDDLEWLREWCDDVRKGVASGRSYRRACVVSEPLSEYQRWSRSITHAHLEVGEDIRWVPRRLVSSIAFPGNDFWMFDDRLVVFLIYTGTGQNSDFVPSAEAADIQLCRSSFEAVWKLAIPHREYNPA